MRSATAELAQHRRSAWLVLVVPRPRADTPSPPATSPGAVAGPAADLSPTLEPSTSGRPGDRFFSGHDKRPILLYDGVCRFCNAGVDFLLANDSSGRLRLAALQSPAGRELLIRAGRSPDDLSSIVYMGPPGSGPAGGEGGLVRAEAVLAAGRCLDGPVLGGPAGLAALAGFFLVGSSGSVGSFASPLRGAADALYDVVADNRYRLMGTRTECRLEDETSDKRFDDRFLEDGDGVE